MTPVPTPDQQKLLGIVRFAAQVRDFGLSRPTIAAWTLLRAAASGGRASLSPATLALLTGYAPPTIRRAIAALGRLGLVRRLTRDERAETPAPAATFQVSDPGLPGPARG
jgi:hypothetical protein